jgi:N-hydroxyarylamine O-acetyltransferase
MRPDVVDAVLDRLGVDREADLKALYAAWCQAVPWDSAQKRVYFSTGASGPLPGSSSDEFFSTWLAHGCGGTCWAGSLALHALLTALGFEARLGAGFVHREGDPLTAVPNHGTVLVGDVIVDSSFLTGDPLVLPPGDEERTFHFRSFRPQGGDRWRLLLTDVPLDLAGAWHEATRQSSPFNRMLNVRANRGDDVVGWSWGQAARIRPDGIAEVFDADRTAWLVEEIGFSEELAASLPADDLVHAG